MCALLHGKEVLFPPFAIRYLWSSCFHPIQLIWVCSIFCRAKCLSSMLLNSLDRRIGHSPQVVLHIGWGLYCDIDTQFWISAGSLCREPIIRSLKVRNPRCVLRLLSHYRSWSRFRRPCGGMVDRFYSVLPTAECRPRRRDPIRGISPCADCSPSSPGWPGPRRLLCWGRFRCRFWTPVPGLSRPLIAGR